MLFAEVFSGASQAWFMDGWGLLFTFPFYLCSVLFFLGLALKIKKASLPQLYFLGMIFGLYESWMTKVLWAGYPGQAGPAAGTIAGLGVVEFPMLVFFWHSIMSFIVPILVFEILTGRILEEHANLLKKSAKKTIVITTFLVLVSTFMATGNGFDPASANLSLIGTLLLVFGLYCLAKKSNLKFFEFGKISPAVLAACLSLFYVGAFFWLWPERIPKTPMPYISIIIFYVISIFLILKSKTREIKFAPADKNCYSAGDLAVFAIIEILAVNLASLLPGVSSLLFAAAYFALLFIGSITFIKLVYKSLRFGV